MVSFCVCICFVISTARLHLRHNYLGVRVEWNALSTSKPNQANAIEIANKIHSIISSSCLLLLLGFLFFACAMHKCGIFVFFLCYFCCCFGIGFSLFVFLFIFDSTLEEWKGCKRKKLSIFLVLCSYCNAISISNRFENDKWCRVLFFSFHFVHSFHSSLLFLSISSRSISSNMIALHLHLIQNSIVLQLLDFSCVVQAVAEATNKWNNSTWPQ